MLLRRFAGGEELRNLLLPLECTADPSETGATIYTPAALSSHAPWPNRKQRSDRERGKGDRSAFMKTRRQNSGTPAIQVLAFEGATCVRRGLLAGGHLPSPPPAEEGMTHDHC